MSCVLIFILMGGGAGRGRGSGGAVAAAKGDVEQESLLVLAAVHDILAALGTPMSAMVLPWPPTPT